MIYDFSYHPSSANYFYLQDQYQELQGITQLAHGTQPSYYQPSLHLERKFSSSQGANLVGGDYKGTQLNFNAQQPQTNNISLPPMINNQHFHQANQQHTQLNMVSGPTQQSKKQQMNQQNHSQAHQYSNSQQDPIIGGGFVKENFSTLNSNYIQNSNPPLPQQVQSHSLQQQNYPYRQQSLPSISGITNTQGMSQQYSNSNLGNLNAAYYKYEAIQNYDSTSYFGIQPQNYSDIQQPPLFNNYSSECLGIYDLSNSDDVIMQMCSPNPHASFGQYGQNYSHLAPNQGYQSNHHQHQNMPSLNNKGGPNSDYITRNHKNYTKNQPSHQQYGYSNNSQIAPQSPRFLNNELKLESQIHSGSQLNYQQTQDQGHVQNQMNRTTSQHQKLPCFSEIQQHQNSLSQEHVGNIVDFNNSEISQQFQNLNSNLSQQSQKQLNSPYFGPQSHLNGGLPSPSNTSRIDLIMCHGQQELEREEKNHSNSLINHQPQNFERLAQPQNANYSNSQQNFVSVGAQSTNPNTGNNSHLRDSLFSNNESNKLPPPPASIVNQNIVNTIIPGENSNQEQFPTMVISKVNKFDTDEIESQQNISSILFTPNHKDKLLLSGFSNINLQRPDQENKINFLNTNLLENVPRPKDIQLNSHQKIEKLKQITQLKNEFTHDSKSEVFYEDSLNSQSEIIKVQNVSDKIKVERKIMPELKSIKIQEKIGEIISTNIQQQKGFSAENNDKIPQYLNTKGKYDSSPEQNFQHIINAPLSINDYQNFNFDEDLPYLKQKEPGNAIKRQRGSNSQYELTFSKQESLDRVSFSYMVGQQIKRNQSCSSCCNVPLDQTNTLKEKQDINSQLQCCQQSQPAFNHSHSHLVNHNSNHHLHNHSIIQPQHYLKGSLPPCGCQCCDSSCLVNNMNQNLPPTPQSSAYYSHHPHSINNNLIHSHSLSHGPSGYFRDDLPLSLLENGRSSSQNSNSNNFCHQCHQFNLLKLMDDEQQKIRELEVIKHEKAQILNNVAKHQQEQQDNFMLFFCSKVDGSQTRKIGKLTLQERYVKIKRFKEKKESRVWKKKISYDCRKKVADKRLRIKGRFVSKAGEKLLFQDIFGNGEIFPEDIKQFNDQLRQVMNDYQKEKFKRSQLGVKDFLIHQHDDKGIRHSFFDFKKFSNFIEEGEDNENGYLEYATLPDAVSQNFGISQPKYLMNNQQKQNQLASEDEELKQGELLIQIEKRHQEKGNIRSEQSKNKDSKIHNQKVQTHEAQLEQAKDSAMIKTKGRKNIPSQTLTEFQKQCEQNNQHRNKVNIDQIKEKTKKITKNKRKE